MKNIVSLVEGRQLITKEFAAAMSGQVPSPYLRLHDHVQKGLVDVAATRRGQSLDQTAYFDRMIHFWREVSLADLPRSGRGLDECYALLFESAFDLAEAEPGWALECLAAQAASERPHVPLTELARQVTHYGNEISHINLATTFTVLYAPWREREEKWNNELTVAFLGDTWFWTAILCAAGIEETHSLWQFRCALSDASVNGWRDSGRLHLRLIREAPRRAQVTPRAELMAHPLLRLARLKYPEGSVEQKVALRFFNARSIDEGFESENDYFSSDLTLAQWVRDARSWGEQLLRSDPHVCAAMLDELGKNDVDANLAFYREELGEQPEQFDDLDATAALIRWGKRRRGNKCLRYRAELLEFAVDIVDAALWLGWLFPRMPVSTAETRRDLRFAPARSKRRATKRDRVENAAIRKAVLIAAAHERQKAGFSLFGRGHEPRITLDRSVAAILRALDVPRVYVSRRRYYPRRIFARAIKSLKKKYGRSPIALSQNVYRVSR